MDIINEAKNRYSKFANEDFREGQYEAIKTAIEGTKKVTALCLPTGAGKSLIGICIATALGGGTYSVHSRPLQVQLQGDFPEVPIIWGRSNYRCLRRGGETTCSECTHSKVSACGFKSGGCEYVKAKRTAIQSNVRILNNEYWITEANYVGGFGHEGVVVIDEADALEGSIAKFIGLEFSGGLMRRLGVRRPKYITTSSKNSIDDWKGWADHTKGRVVKLLRMLQETLDPDYPDESAIRKIETLTGLIRRLDGFIEHVDESWLYEERVSGSGYSTSTSTSTSMGTATEQKGVVNVTFKPTWVSRELAEKYVWGYGKRFILMSATFPPLPVLAKTLGLNMGDIEYREFPSSFPVSNRPVILRGVANLTYKTMDEERGKLIDEIRRILEAHPTEKGLIHCVSYRLARDILEIGDPRLLAHNGVNKIDTLEYFKNSKEPLVLVSPSSERGISLMEDECRFVIWAKAPFLSLADKLVQARIYKSAVGGLWYRADAILTVVQGCGRAVRSKQDKAVTYILDKQIIRLFTENPGMIPGWFKEAI
jgi:ATP-dependent DNA helicase DinG